MSPDLKIDFTTQSFLQKLKSAQTGAQPFRKALLLSGKTGSVLDAMAGRGHDAFLMASWGFKVCAFERNLEVWAQLNSALQAIDAQSSCGELLNSNLRFEFGDSLTVALERGLKPDIVYLDPMYAVKKKSAASTKEIINLREVVGPQPESLEKLIKLALNICRIKVVLKHPLHEAAPLKPTHSYKGSSTRYDVYLKAPSVK